MESTPAPSRARTRAAVAAAVAAVVLAAIAGAFAVGRSVAPSPSAASPVQTQLPAPTRSLAATGSRTAAQIAAATVAGVVSISASTTRNGPQSVSGGTGFVLDRRGRILTNEHVVGGASMVSVAFDDGTKARATVLADDPLLDLAVLDVNVPAAALKPLTLGSANTLRLGDPVLAIGNPFGLDRSVSVGVVSGLRRQITAPNGFTLSNAVQTDAAINHGNSGGPLVDRNGRVIGVNAQIADSGVDGNVGVGFAIAIDRAVKRAIASMAEGKRVTHSWLGVSVDEVDAILGTSNRVRVSSGVLVTGIVPGGPAARAGLRGGSTTAQIAGATYCLGGDIVTRVAGTKVATSGELQTVIASYAPGSTVQLAVVRADGSSRTIPVTLGTQPTAPPSTITGCR